MAQEEVEALNTEGEDMLTDFRSTCQELKRSPLENTGFEGLKGKYMTRLHESNITPTEFMKEQVTEAQLYQCYVNEDFMKKMYCFKQEWAGSGAEEHTLEETLDRFTAAQECLVDDPVKAIDDARHGEVLRAVYSIFFERKDPKKHLVWLYGRRNTGKSTFIKLFESLFSCQRIQFETRYITTREKSQAWAM